MRSLGRVPRSPRSVRSSRERTHLLALPEAARNRQVGRCSLADARIHRLALLAMRRSRTTTARGQSVRPDSGAGLEVDRVSAREALAAAGADTAMSAWRACPKCGEPMEHGAHAVKHLRSEHGMTKDEAASESVRIMREDAAVTGADTETDG